MSCHRTLFFKDGSQSTLKVGQVAPFQVLHCRALRGIWVSWPAQSSADLTEAYEVEALRCESLRSMSCDC